MNLSSGQFLANYFTENLQQYMGSIKLLFLELETMMEDKKNHQAYYEAAYNRLIEKNVPFHALDISGLKWTEIDTKDDFIKAGKIFNEKSV